MVILSHDAQRILGEVDIWSKLRHENIIPALGFTTKCEHTVAIVTPWMSMGNAHDYVQNQIVDPRPLVSSFNGIRLTLV